MSPLSQGVSITVVGLVMVFAVLGAIAGVVALLGRIDAGWRAGEARADEQAGERIQTIDTTTLVIISAAVATLLDGRGRVRSVRRLPAAVGSSPWSAQGRAVLQGSHMITKKS